MAKYKVEGLPPFLAVELREDGKIYRCNDFKEGVRYKDKIYKNGDMVSIDIDIATTLSIFKEVKEEDKKEVKPARHKMSFKG